MILGGTMVGISALVLAYTPHWAPAIPASLVGGFGFFMFHNVMQANATQMAPMRGTAVSMFASFLFLGQSIGVALAAGLIDRIGSSAVVALGRTVMAVEGGLLCLGTWGQEVEASEIKLPCYVTYVTVR